MNIYRQGDVLLQQVSALSHGAVKVPASTRIVLAHGEVTGHAHAIDAEQAEEYQMQDRSSVLRFLRVTSLAHVVHEEHAPIPLPAGIYQIVQQREYTPEAIQQVAD